MRREGKEEGNEMLHSYEDHQEPYHEFPESTDRNPDKKLDTDDSPAPQTPSSEVPDLQKQRESAERVLEALRKDPWLVPIVWISKRQLKFMQELGVYSKSNTATKINLNPTDPQAIFLDGPLKGQQIPFLGGNRIFAPDFDEDNDSCMHVYKHVGKEDDDTHLFEWVSTEKVK